MEIFGLREFYNTGVKNHFCKIAAFNTFYIQHSHHIETSQLTSDDNQMTGFYMLRILWP